MKPACSCFHNLIKFRKFCWYKAGLYSIMSAGTILRGPFSDKDRKNMVRQMKRKRGFENGQKQIILPDTLCKIVYVTVEHCEESGKGTWLVILNQTGFYPEGGGQPMIQEP